MTTPTPIRTMGAPDADASLIMKVLCRATWTMMPTTISARPHSCGREGRSNQCHQCLVFSFHFNPGLGQWSLTTWWKMNAAVLSVWPQLWITAGTKWERIHRDAASASAASVADQPVCFDINVRLALLPLPVSIFDQELNRRMLIDPQGKQRCDKGQVNKPQMISSIN